MKTTILRNLTSLFLAAAVSTAALSAAEKILGGPKGGRLLATEPQKAEFVVNADHKVEIRFYDASLQPAAPGAQTVSVIAEPKSGRTKLDFDKTPTGFVSTNALPRSDEPYRVVVQVRSSPDAKPQNFRVNLNLATCGECSRAEYACTCEGH